MINRAICEAFDTFHSLAQREMGKHANLLSSFTVDVEALHMIPIHSAIAKESNRFLADYVPLEKLQNWALNCKEAHGAVSYS